MEYVCMACGWKGTKEDAVVETSASIAAMIGADSYCAGNADDEPAWIQCPNCGEFCMEAGQ